MPFGGWTGRVIIIQFWFEDVIHREGALHFLTYTEHIFEYNILDFQEVVWLEVVVHWYYIWTRSPHNFNVIVSTRYLVDSHGELLMVVRLLILCSGQVVSLCVGAFQVYRFRNTSTV